MDHDTWCDNWINDDQYISAYKHEFRKFLPMEKPTIDNTPIRCDICGSDRIVKHQDNCIMTCFNCGSNIDRELDTSLNLENINKKIKHNKYKRILHFTSTLRCIQGIEPINITSTDEQKIRESISTTFPDKSPQDLTTQDVRESLQKNRKRGLPKFYDHCQAILCRLYDHPHPIITPDEERFLIHMFMMIQAPFEKYKGKRKNFLSYRLVSLRLGELLNIPAIVNNTSSLKCDDKRSKQNSIWNNICEDLSWGTHSSKKKS